MADDLDDLFKVALAVRLNAHAPYSGFQVGAVIEDTEGRLHAGCNVENVAYPEGTCAEAGAIAAMCAAHGVQKVTRVLVVADSPTPVTPCGGCRQKLAEFGSPEMVVHLANLAGIQLTMTMGELLPGAFGVNHMTLAHGNTDD